MRNIKAEKYFLWNQTTGLNTMPHIGCGYYEAYRVVIVSIYNKYSLLMKIYEMMHKWNGPYQMQTSSDSKSDQTCESSS
jgi:hypothetical protein